MLQESKKTIETKREIAKIGMGVSLFLTASSALFLKNKVAKNIHILSGISLVGFSLWHSSLYPKEKPLKKKKLEK
ncbi:hypothetical protein [Helicobacter burdigaliensis]|uniref:hypothetical protein n=1 Tax=Helicobacter burdigaliensis TaxID=2315334 RepID=UPI000EF67B65|nr:hypothetical protein [Helicobacter burdigaliensis]